MCLKLIFLYLIDSECMYLYNMRTINGRNVPIIEQEMDFFMVIRHSFFIINLALLSLPPARRIVLESFWLYIWLKKKKLYY